VLEFLVCMGEPLNRPLYKLVGYGGGLVHTSKEAVWTKMREYMDSPQHFGKAAARRAQEAAEAASSDAAYVELPASTYEPWELITGFFDPGDEIKEGLGCKGRWRERELVAPGNVVGRDEDGVLRAPWGKAQENGGDQQTGST